MTHTGSWFFPGFQMLVPWPRYIHWLRAMYHQSWGELCTYNVLSHNWSTSVQYSSMHFLYTFQGYVPGSCISNPTQNTCVHRSADLTKLHVVLVTAVKSGVSPHNSHMLHTTMSRSTHSSNMWPLLWEFYYDIKLVIINLGWLSCHYNLSLLYVPHILLSGLLMSNYCCYVHTIQGLEDMIWPHLLTPWILNQWFLNRLSNQPWAGCFNRRFKNHHLPTRVLCLRFNQDGKL